MAITLEEISRLVGGTRQGPGDLVCTGVAGLEAAGPGDLVALEDQRRISEVDDCSAEAFLVAPQLAESVGARPHVAVAHPQIALNQVIETLNLYQAPWGEVDDAPRIHERAQVDPGAELGAGCRIDAYAVVGAGARLGAQTIVGPHSVIEGGALLGARCWIQAHAVITAHARLGDRVIVGHHSTVGSCGFGWGFDERGATRLHHIGTAELGDGVELGSSTTIDRGRFGATKIGPGVKIDNQCHVAHNCEIGAGTMIAAQVGIAGSSRVGSRCLIAGQAGIGGHLQVTDGTIIGANTGVASNIRKAGTYFGYWAQERQVALREIASMKKVPDALKQLRSLEQRVDRLTDELAEARDTLPEG